MEFILEFAAGFIGGPATLIIGWIHELPAVVLEMRAFGASLWGLTVLAASLKVLFGD